MVLVERILGIAHTYAPHIFRTKGKHTPPTLAQGQFLVRRAADVVVGRRPKKRSLHEVNEHFQSSPILQLPPTSAQGQFLVRRAADVAVGRRLKKRSLRYVNEHFSVKPNLQFPPTSAGDPISCQKGGRCGSGSQTEKAEFTICK